MSLKNKDIAEMLDISPAAVSLARNNKPGVSPRTRKMVRELLDKHEKEKAAGGIKEAIRLVFSVHKKHGLIIAETPFFLSLTEDIQRQAVLASCDVVIMQYNPCDDPEKYIQNIIDMKAHGILLLATEMDDSDLQLYRRANLPLVLIDSHFMGEKFDSVCIANIDAMHAAISYAKSCGHTEIGFLRSKIANNNFIERLTGWKIAMDRMGLVIHPEYIFDVGSQADSAYADMKAHLAASPRLPTMLTAGNDLLAIGVLRALKESGIRVPEDVSIIGFDDMPISRMMDPPLTSMRIYNNVIGEKAVQRLVDQIHYSDGRAVFIEIGCDLIARDSVARIS